MTKLLFALPTALLLITPTAALANGHNPGGSSESFEHRQDTFHRNPISTVSAYPKDHDNDADKDDDKKNETTKFSVKTGDNKGTNVKLTVKNWHWATGSATASATPSASLKIKGPIDQVILVLEKIINFLKSLV